MNITRVGVVGGGLMGAGIAEVCARAGSEVTVVEADSDRAEAAYRRIVRSTGKAVARGKMLAEDQEQTLARVSVNADLESLSESQLVIEAVSEVEDLKLDISSGSTRSSMTGRQSWARTPPPFPSPGWPPPLPAPNRWWGSTSSTRRRS